MGDKKARHRDVQTYKRSAQAGIPDTRKSAKITHNPDHTLKAKIAWNFGLMDSGGQWPCSLKRLDAHHSRLVFFEGRAVEDIFNSAGGDRHSHLIAVDRIILTAQKRLEALNIDANVLHQLSLGHAPRLWGVLQHNIFHILWLDEKHEVCP